LEDGPPGGEASQGDTAVGGQVCQAGFHLGTEGLSLGVITFVLQGLHHPRQDRLHLSDEAAASIKLQSLFPVLQRLVYLAAFQVTAGYLQSQITGAAPHPSLGCSLGQALEDGRGFLVSPFLEQALSVIQQLQGTARTQWPTGPEWSKQHFFLLCNLGAACCAPTSYPS